jgi:hypothetical protein
VLHCYVMLGRVVCFLFLFILSFHLKNSLHLWFDGAAHLPITRRILFSDSRVVLLPLNVLLRHLVRYPIRVLVVFWRSVSRLSACRAAWWAFAHSFVTGTRITHGSFFFKLDIVIIWKTKILIDLNIKNVVNIIE